MKKVAGLLAATSAWMAFTTGALAGNPLQEADEALRKSAAAVDKAGKKEAELKEKGKKDGSRCERNQGRGSEGRKRCEGRRVDRSWLTQEIVQQKTCLTKTSRHLCGSFRFSRCVS